MLCALAVALTLVREHAPVIIEENGFYIEDGVLQSYSGSDTEVILPEAVIAIADYAFRDNAARETITTVTLGKNVQTVGANAFAGLDQLMSLILEDESTAFVERDGAIFTFDGSMLVRFTDRDAVEYTLPSGVRYIAAHAFQQSGLTEITFCDTLEYIGYNAFAGCALTAIYLPDSVTQVEEGAFASCTRAVDGYIPMDAELGNEAFEGVPFFLTQIAGHISPLEQIVRAQISPTEAIALSNRENLLGQLDAILAYYRDGTVPSGGYARLAHIVGASLPAEAILPNTADFTALRFRDNGWGGMGIYDIQLRLPLGDAVTMVCEAYLYGGALDLLDWEDACWRVESVMFITASEENTALFGDWRVMQDGSALGFYNAMTDGAVRAELPITGAFEYRLTFSPQGNRVIIEYRVGEEWMFRIQSLDGEMFETSMNSYADYMNRYFGQYVFGSLGWRDNDTVTGENEYGSFEFSPYTVYPRQLTDYRRDYLDDVTVTRTLAVFDSGRENAEYTIAVPQTWVGDSYLSDIRRMETTPEDATRMTGYYVLYDADALYCGGEWDLQALSMRGMSTYQAETVVNDARMLILHTAAEEVEHSRYNAAVKAGDKVLICQFTVYPEDAADYYTRVILPVIESFTVTVSPKPYTALVTRYSSAGLAMDGPDSAFFMESIRYVGGKTLATLLAEDDDKVVADVTAAIPYDSDREGEQLYRDEVPPYAFRILGDDLQYAVDTVDGLRLIPLGDVSALWK